MSEQRTPHRHQALTPQPPLTPPPSGLTPSNQNKTFQNPFHLSHEEQQEDEERSGLRPKTHGPVDHCGVEDGGQRVDTQVARRLGQKVGAHAVGARRTLANHEASLWGEESHARLALDTGPLDEEGLCRERVWAFPTYMSASFIGARLTERGMMAICSIVSRGALETIGVSGNNL